MPFISETVHPSIRGNLVILTALFMATGKFFVWTVGYQVSWRMTAFILTIPPCLMTLLITFFPETPYWLIENTNYHGAKKSLQFYRGKDYDITEELNEIKHEISKNFSMEMLRFPKYWSDLSNEDVLVSEYIEGKSLEEGIEEKSLSWDTLLQLFRIHGAYLFGIGTFHGDLHPGNCIIDNDKLMILTSENPKRMMLLQMNGIPSILVQ